MDLNMDRDYIFETLCAQIDESRIEPGWGMKDDRFKEISYYNWAQDKILDEIEDSFFTTPDRAEFEALMFAKDIIIAFEANMDRFAKMKKSTSQIFLTAKQAAEDMFDILEAME